MKIKSKSYLFFLLLILISLSLYGCQQDSNHVHSGLSLDSITKKLKEEHDIFRVEQPSNKEYVIYAKGDEKSAQVFIWKVNEDKPVAIGEKIDSVGRILISPDSKFALIDSGFDVLLECEVVSIEEMKQIGKFHYANCVDENFSGTYPYFSPDCKQVIYTNDKFIPEIIQEDDFPSSYGVTLSIAGFNFISKNEQILCEGNEKYYFMPESTDEKGIIHITKRYFGNKEITEKISINTNKSHD